MPVGDDNVKAPMERWQELGRLVRERRIKELGLSQQEIANRADPRVSVSTYGDIERGDEESYRPKSLLGVSRALGWADDAIENFVLHGTPPESQPGAAAADPGERDELRAIREEQEVMRGTLDAVLKVVEQMAKHLGLGSML